MATPHLSRDNSTPPGNWTAGFWLRLISLHGSRRRQQVVWGAVVLVLLVGLADFVSGVEASMLVFYFLPVALAVTGLSWRAGVVTALACVSIWLVGETLADRHYSHQLVRWWNAGIAFGTYLVLIWLLHSLLTLQRHMEERVRHRTADLTEEIAERERLEKVIMEISERERRRIGRDLHDDLGQHLTGTALASQVLGEKLQARSAEEEPDAWRIVTLVEQGIEKTRNLAKGLLLAEIEPDGLRTALQELASATEDQARIICEFHCTETIRLEDSIAATHLFRITQEAVHNALRHGKAKYIEIALRAEAGQLVLTVLDDGCGLPPSAARGHGLGLRIMAHRAAMINAGFTVERQPDGGTLLTCRLPA